MKNRYFFRDKNSEYCYKISYHRDYMRENNISEMTIYLAERELRTNTFFCRFFNEVGERGNCNSGCKGYKPMNRISGKCSYNTFSYQNTQKEYKIKLLK